MKSDHATHPGRSSESLQITRTKSSTKKTTPMILTAAGRAGGGGVCRRTIHCPRLAHLDTRLLRGRSRDGDFPSRPAEEPDQSGKEHDHGTAHGHAAEAADMLRVSRSGGCRLITAAQWESIKIGRSQRISVASTRHVAAQSVALEGVDARTQPPGGLATPGMRRRQAMCSRHHPLWTTADVAAFLMYGPTAARQLLQIAARRGPRLHPSEGSR
jgi:hypothetical protein